MSGHSKWSKIKREKELKDKTRSNIFSKLSRLITLAVIEGGGIADPENNIRLRMAVDKAKAANMPHDNILRALEKASGPSKSALRTMVYEGFGPGGVSFLIEATTDNANRTFSEVRNIMERNSGKLGSVGSVAYLFLKCGLAMIPKKLVKETEVFSFCEALKALDMEENEDAWYCLTPFEALGQVKGALKSREGVTIEVIYKPQSVITIADKTIQKQIDSLMELLEDQAEVQKVFTNAVYEQIEGA